VAVLGYDYWQAHWAADPRAVGRFVQVWFPVAIRPVLVSGSVPIQQDFSRATDLLFGKLKAGISRAAGDAELTSLTRELIRTQPRYFREHERIQAQPVQEAMIRGAERSPPVAIFIVMVLLILLSACANLGNMLLARGLARQREIDIRLALGAAGARIVRQLMTENFLLAIIGTAAGLAFGSVSVRLLMNALNAPPSIHVSMGWPLLVAGVVLTFASAAVFGLPPAFETIRANHRKAPLRQSLVGVQVAISCLLLIASAVMAHNRIVSASVDFAFDYRNMIIVDPQLYTRNLPAPIVRQKLDTLTARLTALPGVGGVTAAVAPPLGGD
jgi:hypothetical protein